MKYIDNLRIINKGLMIITILLYMTIFLGLISQIVLGAYQVIVALVLLCFWSGFSKKVKNKLLHYYAAVLTYGLYCSIDLLGLARDYWGVLYGIIPMLIALYFSLLLEDIKQEE